MKTRVTTAIIALILFIPVLILHDTIVLTIVISLLSAVAVYEMTTCIEAPKSLKMIGVIIGLALPVAADIDIAGDYVAALFRHTALPAAVFSVAIILMTYSFRPKRMFLPIYIAAVLYPSAGLGLVVFYERYEVYPLIFLMFFITSWVTDSFALFSGKLFGKKKLSPTISPKKTVEGAIGGTVAAVVAFIIYALIVEESILICVFLGLLLSVAAQCGDLLASALKRAYEIKDYGKVFPGHGGVMDRFDSVLLVAHVFNAFAIIYSLI